MLAQPKGRKLKWSLDPQNVAWANDKSKFGLRMMQGMGWEEGESLGIAGTGITKHIELKPAVDNRGLGYGVSDSFESQLQPDFEDILKSLNKRYSSTEAKSTDQSYFPIEQGAAKSRPLRYRRFVQAKDLSRKSSEELSCVFAKRKCTEQRSSISDLSAQFAPKEESLEVVGSEQNSFESTKRKLTLMHTDVPLDDPMLSVASCTTGMEQIGYNRKFYKKTRSKRRNKRSN